MLSQLIHKTRALKRFISLFSSTFKGFSFSSFHDLFFASIETIKEFILIFDDSLIKTLSPEIKDSTALFLFVRFVEFINQRWRDGNLKTNKRNKLLRPVICCLGQLILDYSNFKSFSSRFRVRLRRESRYLAVEIRWMVGAGKDEEDTKIFQKTNFQITQRNRQTRISHLII